MNSKVSMHWFSKKGSTRAQNSDACAVFYNQSYAFAIIGDASEKGNHGREYLMQWMSSVVDSVFIETSLNCESIIGIMKKEHEKLRTQFVSSRACWGALFIDHKTEKTWTFSCGDCRVGIEHYDGSVEWLTPVHSLANWRGEEFTNEHAWSSCRHQVTRTLKSKRFAAPAVLENKYDIKSNWILATDGYWIEQRIKQIPIENLEDDSSFLRFSYDRGGTIVDTDYDNYYISTSPTI